ncbi:uncharacterized protein [Oryctolagus cuniculus]|uniref:uncharacterized protein isoform X1 n=1 Tax=Oryctolagus cuniculus TaxID=9986 RepID=UPI0038795315
MSQKPQPDPLDAQPAAPNSTQAESHDSPPVIYIRRLNAHDPTPIIQSRRASIWGTSPIANTSQVNSQELFPALRTRRVSIQEPLPSGTPRWVSTQEPLHPGSPRRVSIQEPLPPGTPRRVSIQEPPPPGSPRRVSIQEPPPPGTPRRVSIQEPPPPGTPRRVSIQEPPPSGTPRRVSIRDASALQSRSFSSQTSSVLGSMDSTLQGSSVNVQNYLTAQNRKQSLSSARCSIEVPPSITHSPEASISSIESVICDSLDSLEEAVQAQLEHSTLEGTHSFTSVTSIGDLSSRFQKGSHQSLLPICWRLLHEAKKITRYVSLVLTLAGLLVINLISLGQPWLHFQVPLRPPGDPAGPQTIPIDTIIFVRCPDISCLHEYDQNAYLLDLAWAFIVFSSISSLCLFITLVSTIFFTTSNLPVLDFSMFVSSVLTEARNSGLATGTAPASAPPHDAPTGCGSHSCAHSRPSETNWPPWAEGRSSGGPKARGGFRCHPRLAKGTSIILGVLFYLLQASQFLQEGMTYRLGVSFYLAWMGVFFFLMIGLLSYLNYKNFWSILALQGIWI